MGNVVTIPAQIHRYCVVKCQALRLVNSNESTVTARKASDVAATLMNSGSTAFDYFSVIPLAAGLPSLAYRRVNGEWVHVRTEADVEAYERSFPRDVQERELGYFYNEAGVREYLPETA